MCEGEGATNGVWMSTEGMYIYLLIPASSASSFSDGVCGWNERPSIAKPGSSILDVACCICFIVLLSLGVHAMALRWMNWLTS